MKRRILLAAAAGGAAGRFAAHAQPAKTYRVGFVFPNAPVADMLGPEPRSRYAKAFVHALRALGYVEGQNLVLERRSAEGKSEQFDAIVSELVASRMDIIIGAGNPMAEAVKRAASTVPVVMAGLIDPLRAGIVTSLAKPGGGITGFTFHGGSEIEGRRLQMLKQAVPRANRVAYMYTSTDWEGPDGESVRATMQALGMSLIQSEVAPERYADSFETVIRGGAEAIYSSRSGVHFISAQFLADFALARRLPSIHAWREVVEAGGLISYGADYADILRRAAGYVDSILKGAKAGDLPIQQPTKYELLINLRTAKTLGIDIPPTLLAGADAVIE